MTSAASAGKVATYEFGGTTPVLAGGGVLRVSVPEAAGDSDLFRGQFEEEAPAAEVLEVELRLRPQAVRPVEPTEQIGTEQRRGPRLVVPEKADLVAHAACADPGHAQPGIGGGAAVAQEGDALNGDAVAAGRRLDGRHRQV